MNPPTSPSSKPLFDIDGAITAPNLRRIGSIDHQMIVLSMLADDARNYLGQGALPGPIKIEHDGELGRYLAHALVHGQAKNAENIALLYVFSHEAEQNILSDLARALNQEGRLDLFRPGAVLLQQACQEQWGHTAQFRQKISRNPGSEVDEILAGTHLPDESTWAPETRMEEDLDRREFCVGAAWIALGPQVARMVTGPNNQQDSVRFADRCALVLDVVASVPETRAWAGYALVGAAQSIGAFQEAWCGEDIAAPLISLSQRLTDAEAGAVMQQLALAIGHNEASTPTKKNMERLAQNLIANHPQLTLEDWLRAGEADRYLDGKSDRQNARYVKVAAGRVKDARWLSGTGGIPIEHNGGIDTKAALRILSMINWVGQQVGVDHSTMIRPDTNRRIEMLLSSYKKAYEGAFPLLVTLREIQLLNQAGGLEPKDTKTADGDNREGPNGIHRRRSKL